MRAWAPDCVAAIAARQPAAPVPITRTLAVSVRCMCRGYAADGRALPSADLPSRQAVDVGTRQARGLVAGPDMVLRHDECGGLVGGLAALAIEEPAQADLRERRAAGRAGLDE